MGESNLDVVRRGYEAFGRGDINGLLAELDGQIQWVSPGPKELATSGRRTGVQEVAEFFKTVNDVFDIQRFEAKEFIVQGNRVIVLGDETVSVRASGTTLNLDWVHVFTVQNGKVVTFQEFFDTAPVVAALKPATAAA